MNRLSKNTKYENRYLLTEEISYDPKSGNQVWAVTEIETEKRLIGRFQGNGKVEWFDDTRPKPKASPSKIEEKLPNILSSISSASKPIEKVSTISIPTIPQNLSPTEKVKPFSIPQINNKSGLTSTIKAFEILKTEIKPKKNINKTTTKLPLYIGLSLLILCIALLAHDKREIILSKIEKPKNEETKVDSSVNVIQERKVIAMPNLQKIEIEKPNEEIIEDTLKLSTDLQAKIGNAKNNNLPKKVRRKKAEKKLENGGFIKL